MSPKIKRKTALLVSAHPDDETIFFGGLILSGKYDFHVICVTDGNADGLGQMRQTQFHQACKLLGAKKSECLEFPDIFEKRLDVSSLRARLAKLDGFSTVFTHGIMGEYGHPHHQDVSFAVHEAFPARTPVYSCAYNIFPEIRINLDEKAFARKTKVLWDIYSGEIRRLIHFLPAMSAEGFTRVSRDEVEALYRTLAGGSPIEEKLIKSYRWLLPYLKEGGGNLKRRPF